MNLLLRLATVLLLATSDMATAAPATPVEGVDYQLIDGGQPFQPTPGKVEVAEVFGYPCPHCAHFEPALEAWAAKLPAQATLVAIPADFRDDWVPYARAYFAAKALGVTAIPSSTSRGKETFFDVKVFDPADPAAYLSSLGIKRIA